MVALELTLTRTSQTCIDVACNGQPSHTFDPHTLPVLPTNGEAPDDALTYGRALYLMLFPPASLALSTLVGFPERIVLVTTDEAMDAVAWEYVCGPDGQLVQDYPFMRALLPVEQRHAPPAMDGTLLHVVAVPSDPLDDNLEPLNIDGEWTRLKECFNGLPHDCTLERARPAAVEQVRALVANQRLRVVHFMGHGGQHAAGAVLCFEKENGTLDLVPARNFVQRVRNNVFLVTLNACVTATPGPSAFNNLAAALVRYNIPYALGMRFKIYDTDARTFSRSFYSELARGTPVEEALHQARLSLAYSPTATGIPVLYTSLTAPAAGFAIHAGAPHIDEHQPPMHLSALPRVNGSFIGRLDDIRLLGSKLTGDNRARIVTIHGSGGQGKTTLARAVVERFAYAWPGGVWSVTLENLPARSTLAVDLARFLGIDTQSIIDPDEIERLIQSRLALQRTLLVLDNAESLLDAVAAKDAAAIELAAFLQRLPGPTVSLLATSRAHLQWPGEYVHELDGLSDAEGAALFIECAPQRDIQSQQAEALSHILEGHPFSLRLLASTFNELSIPLPTFIQEHEARLTEAENKYAALTHRRRTLYASLDTSTRHLPADLRALLSGLWIFYAPFLPEHAVAIFDSDFKETDDQRSPVRDRLHALWQRSLLTHEVYDVREGLVEFYHLLPIMRRYVKERLEQSFEETSLLARFGAAYAGLANYLYGQLNKGAVASLIALQASDDLERGINAVDGLERGQYLLDWGWVMYRLGNPQRGAELLEEARAMMDNLGHEEDKAWIAASALYRLALLYQSTGRVKGIEKSYEDILLIWREMKNRKEEAITLNSLALLYQDTGRVQEAEQYYEQALPIRREVGDRAGEAVTLTKLGGLYWATGRMQEAEKLYAEALPITREIGDRAGEGMTLNSLALLYRHTGRVQEAEQYYAQALLITHEVGDRAGEAATLNNLAVLYRATGRVKEAEQYYEQSLPIRREVGDRAGEAATLNNLAGLYQHTGRVKEAEQYYEQALPIRREVGDRAGEAVTLGNLAWLLYEYLNRPEEAMAYMEQAIEVLQKTDLPQDAAGQTVEQLEDRLQKMRVGVPLASNTLPSEHIQQLIDATIAVMAIVQDKRDEWRGEVTERLQYAQQQGSSWQIEVDLYSAILAILDGRASVLPEGHPYARVVARMRAGIVGGPA